MSEAVDAPRTRVDDGVTPSEARGEPAIRGSGSSNSLVVVLKARFTGRVDENRE